MESLREIVPESLRERAQWVVWRFVERRGKRTKVPVDPRSGSAASSTDPATWASFDDSLAATRRLPSIEGVGFVFSDGDPFCGIDLDECIVDGLVVPGAQAIIDAFATYTEISPSGNGVKLFAEARKPEGSGCRSKQIDGFKEIEVYDTGRFFTVTGRHLAGTPRTVEPARAALADLCNRLWPPRATQTREGHAHDRFDGSDDELIQIAIRSKNGAAFERLLHGDISGYGDDHSRADLAFCNMLAFWTGRDAQRIDRIFRSSGLCREKWERTDYRDATIAKAIESCTETYSPPRNRSAADGVGAPIIDGIVAGSAAHGRSEPETQSPSIAALLSDVGNAARLVIRHGDRIRYCHATGQWFIWDDRRWRPDGRGRIVKLCKDTALSILVEVQHAPADQRKALFDWAMYSQKRDRLTAMAALAQPEVAVHPDDLDADPWAFNVLNGTIDLRTGELRPHRRDDLITKIAPVAFDPHAKAPRFERFLDEIFGGDRDLVRFVQRWHGHCLSGDVCEQYLPIYHGVGNNGKSVLLDTVCAVMGDYAGEAPPDLVTVRKHPEHPTEIADLMGRRLVIASETERDAELRLQLIKRLTGNARLKARFMRQDYFEFARTHKMILVTNNRPAIKEDTEAAWRRLRLVPFEVVIPKSKRDPDLMRKLSGEFPGILTWLVHGCVDWLREGLTEPDAVVVATESYRGVANSLDAFLFEQCVIADGLTCATADLMAAYSEWCAQNRRIPIRGRTFAGALKQRRCTPMKMNGRRHWVGVGLERDPAGHNGQNGHELPVERLMGPRERVNGEVLSILSNVSTGAEGVVDGDVVSEGGADG